MTDSKNARSENLTMPLHIAKQSTSTMRQLDRILIPALASAPPGPPSLALLRQVWNPQSFMARRWKSVMRSTTQVWVMSNRILPAKRSALMISAAILALKSRRAIPPSRDSAAITVKVSRLHLCSDCIQCFLRALRFCCCGSRSLEPI